MTGLFGALEARFAPGAAPQIKARPVARFEGPDGAGVVEGQAVADEVRTPPPDAPVRRAPQGRAPAAAGPTREASEPRGEPSLHPAGRARPPREEVRAERMAARPERPVAGPEAPPPASGEAARLPEPSPAARPETREGGTRREGAVTRPETAALREVFTERIVRVEGGGQRAAAPAREKAPAAAAEPEEWPAPALAREPPVIRIGRIEVRQPQPAPPPPKAAAPRAAAAPARRPDAPVARPAPPSRLTDYLGWKR